MELVEEDDADRFEEGIVLQHAEQDAGRYDEDAGLRAALAVKADLIADLVAESSAALHCHAAGGGAGGQAARLQEQDTPLPREAGV